MSVRFLIVVDGTVENVVVAESAECLSNFPGAILQTDGLAHVCVGWRFVEGVFVDPYAPTTETAVAS